jgi:membrane fusion protein (multidrug efflux system)
MNAITSRKVVADGAEPAARPDAPPVAAPKRNLRRLALMLSLPVLLTAGGGYVWLSGGRYETTENASLQQGRVSVSAAVEGRVTEVMVRDDMLVKAGDPLFQIDPRPYRIALDQADAALATARLNVRQLQAAYAQSVAAADAAANDVRYFQTQYDRQRELLGRGVATQTSLDDAGRALHNAEEARIGADQAINRALAALGGKADGEIDSHPAVLAALAAREQAEFDLRRSLVVAPGDGIIAQAEAFRVGGYVNPGAPLFALVETGDTWLDANFKETQIGGMQVGQPATVEFDTYPGREFAAHVSAIGAGTGAEFSLIPAQNATGNWVKVTQRIPVRLTLDPAESLPDLRMGMSATVTVDTATPAGAAAAAEPATRIR